MRLLRLPDDPPPLQLPAVVATIGNFDGVHRGHRALIGRLVERAAHLGAQSAVVTFDPHPLLVIRPDVSLRLLSTLDEKVALFESLGVDNLLVWRFDATLQQTGAAAFLGQLSRWVRLRQLLHGPGFALGKGREGTPELLERIGQQMGFDLDEVIPYVQPAKGILSSTVIRGLIADGQVQAAARGLGRAPTLTGTVVEGEKIGRTLGFPTANLSLDGPLAVPADGVYACWAEVAPFTPAVRRYAAAVSIGTRPTFDGETRAVEAYLLDFVGDLYGQKMRLHFVARLRGQERFDSIAALIAQMQRDVATARGVLRDTSESGDVEHLDLAADG